MELWNQYIPAMADQKRYRLIQPIGEGGFARVFKCHDEELDEVVALKILRNEYSHSENRQKRFKQEIKIARKITHRYVCKIFNFGTHNNIMFIVMEFIEGSLLSKFIKMKGILSQEDVVSIGLKILQGLKAAHELQVMHCDLKPNNIMITRNLDPVIMDFGLAKYFGLHDATTVKSLNSGTPYYMAPEQITSKSFDHRVDLYAFGVILYQLFTGRHPYQEADRVKVLFSHVKETPVHIKEIEPDLDERVAAIVHKCLEKDPQKRYQDAQAVFDDLLTTFTEPQKARNTVVVLAEDDELARSAFKEMFEDLHCTVMEAENGKEAVEKCLKEKPDLICLDLMMPVMGGIEAAEILVSLDDTKDIPIVFISAKNDTDIMHYGRNLGIRDFLVKPLRFEDLQNRLNFWLKPATTL